MAAKYEHEFETGFISESPAKMFHIAEYFEAAAGAGTYPRNYCNAPMVSAVITSTGEIHPCFFLPSFGNVRNDSFEKLINNSQIKQIRSDVADYKPERCKSCVCSLYIKPSSVLMDNF